MSYFIRVATPADTTTVVPQYWEQQIVSPEQKNIYYNDGYVGLGIPNPLSRLAVDGGASIGSLLYNKAVADGVLAVDDKIGIGTALPTARLEVAGNIKAGFGGFQVNNSGAIILDAGVGVPRETNITFIGGGGDTAGNIFYQANGNNQDFGIQFKNQDTYTNTRMSITSDKGGNLQIMDIYGETGEVRFFENVIIDKNLNVYTNVIIDGDLTVNGTQTIINTDTQITDQLIIENAGTGSALIVNQTGNEPIVEFKDDGTTVFKIVNGGDIGVGTDTPANKLDVVGNIQTNKVKLNSVAVSATPSAGHFEFDGQTFEGSTTNNFRGIIPCQSTYILKANRLLLNSTATQNFFDKSITLTAGTTYRFTANINMTLVGTVATILRSIIGGTATYTTLRYSSQANFSAGGTVVGYSINTTAVSSITISGISTNHTIRLDGLLCVNAGGTFIPQFSYSVAPGGAPTVQANSWITLYPIGTNTVSASGDTWV